ncbi:MAG: hypothetical protein H0U32_02175 [Thermoleophilaceae bacterium]|nr:hypothetical protein [Thermoleophilaceae bacterium]
MAGMAGAGLAVVSWAALGREPRLAEPYEHLLVLDPPPVAGALPLVETAPGRGFGHLAWGEPECSFTQSYWREQLDLRPALSHVWRALPRGDGPVGGDALTRVLRGEDSYPRGGALAARLLRVLRELGLVELDRDGRSCTSVDRPRTELDRSATHRAYAARLAQAERHLSAGAQPDERRVAPLGKAS